MRFSLFIITLTLSLTSLAGEKRVCQISQVLNKGYESLYNFSFNNFPNLVFEKNENKQISLMIGALDYSKGNNEHVDIKVYNNPNKYFIFYDDYLSETVEFIKKPNGKNEALLKAILDETDELYTIANFNCG